MEHILYVETIGNSEMNGIHYEFMKQYHCDEMDLFLCLTTTSEKLEREQRRDL